MSNTQEGYLLIADITGYTRYLSESELEHAQATLTALLELLVENTRSPLIISRLAGDAVISYGLLEDFYQGQTFIEKVEDIYVAFRKALKRLVLNNTCRCNACANISTLDLKFFIHYGTFGIQHISDYDELIGSDINLLHRLLKNSVTELTGFRAYALYTEAAIQQLSVDGLEESMTPHQETYDHLGDVKAFVQDMHPLWEQRRSGTSIEFPYDQLMARSEIHIDLPPELVWDYLTQPKFRNTLIGSNRMEVTKREGGRIAPGSIYQCYHGDKWVPHTILEWQPFERVLAKESYIIRGMSALVEYRLDATEDGTRFSRLYARPTGPLLWRSFFRILAPGYSFFAKRYSEAFKSEIEEDYRVRSQAPMSKVDFSGERIREAVAVSLEDTSDRQDA